MSEAVRNLIRIISNFVRSISGMILGIIFARFMLIAVGDEGLGLVLLLASTTGLTYVVLEIIRSSMIRELGVAYHDKSQDNFVTIFNSMVLLCLLASAFAGLGFAVLFFCLPYFNIPDNLMNAAQWLVVVKGIEMCLDIIFAPQMNMYLVKEKMVSFNLWMLLHRFAMVLPSILLVLFFSLDPSTGVKFFAIVSSSAVLLLLAVFATMIIIQDRNLIPAPGKATREGLKTCLDIGKWNVAVIAAVNIHERVSQIIMNFAFGVIGNMIFGFALQLSSYLRTVVQTVTFGVDAVAARMSGQGADRHLQLLMSHSTRVHGFVAFPAFLSVWILAEPLITVWVGRQMQDPTTNIPLTVILIRIISIGIVARAISDGWMRILYGAGHIKQYAPVILLGGLLNPIFCALLYYFILPENLKFTATAWPLMLVFVIIHMGILPVIGAPLLNMRKRELIWPLWRPFLVAMFCSPILWWLLDWVQNWNLLTLFASVIFYGCVYCLFAWFLVINREERQRIFHAIKRMLLQKYDPQPDPTGESED